MNAIWFYLSKQTAPRLKSRWIVFHPWVSQIASPCDNNSYFSAKASVTAASASEGGILSSSWPSRPRVRWKVSFREPALEMMALKSWGRMELRLGRERLLPWGNIQEAGVGMFVCFHRFHKGEQVTLSNVTLWKVNGRECCSLLKFRKYKCSDGTSELCWQYALPVKLFWH